MVPVPLVPNACHHGHKVKGARPCAAGGARGDPPGAAKLYGLYPRKGTIAIGSDADLAIWDPAREVVMSVDILHDEMDYTPYEGTKVTGWPVATLLRGKVVCRELEFVGTQGAGRFLRCEAPLRPASWRPPGAPASHPVSVPL